MNSEFDCFVSFRNDLMIPSQEHLVEDTQFEENNIILLKPFLNNKISKNEFVDENSILRFNKYTDYFQMRQDMNDQIDIYVSCSPSVFVKADIFEKVVSAPINLLNLNNFENLHFFSSFFDLYKDEQIPENINETPSCYSYFGITVPFPSSRFNKIKILNKKFRKGIFGGDFSEATLKFICTRLSHFDEIFMMGHFGFVLSCFHWKEYTQSVFDFSSNHLLLERIELFCSFIKSSENNINFFIPSLFYTLKKSTLLTFCKDSNFRSFLSKKMVQFNYSSEFIQSFFDNVESGDVQEFPQEHTKFKKKNWKAFYGRCHQIEKEFEIKSLKDIDFSEEVIIDIYLNEVILSKMINSLNNHQFVNFCEQQSLPLPDQTFGFEALSLKKHSIHPKITLSFSNIKILVNGDFSLFSNQFSFFEQANFCFFNSWKKFKKKEEIKDNFKNASFQSLVKSKYQSKLEKGSEPSNRLTGKISQSSQSKTTN